MTERVLVAEPPAKGALPERPKPSASAAWGVVAILALVVMAAGLTDVGLQFVPWDLGNPEWEFGTITSVLDSLALSTIGFGLLVAAAHARGWYRAGIGLEVYTWLMVLGLVGSATVYATDLPLAWKALGPDLRLVLVRGVTKTVVLMALYLAFYAGLGVVLWRRRTRPAITQSSGGGG